VQRAHNIHQFEAFDDRVRVFRDRADAGQRLAELLHLFRDANPLLLAIPAGGVPVAAEIAAEWKRSLDVAVVSKILLPWTTEAGYGAVAFDGSVWIDEQQVARYRLNRAQVEQSTQSAIDKVSRRVERFRGSRPFPDLTGRVVVIVDDGLAAGSTMRVAISALRRLAAEQIIVAVPTGHDQSVHLIAGLATQVFCANIRSGLSFAVADAYQRWSDIEEDEVMEILARYGSGSVTTCRCADDS
jgi:predicted phosphoribosyltransferase